MNLFIAKQDRVLIANALVTGHFNEPLKKNGSCDTDGDTLSDGDEIDWSEIKINSDGSYHFPTWGELINQSDYEYSKLSPLYQSLKDVPVIPALSNPFSKDSDNDYYPDNIDKDKMEANPMYIYDKGLDDSYFHKGIAVPNEMVSDKYTDGDFDSGCDFEKNEYYARYSFKRAKRGIYNFTLKPKKLSYYKLTSSGSSRINSVYKTVLGNRVDVVPEDGTYLLDASTEYTIVLFVFNNADDIEFTIEQDNWYKAEKGGILKATYNEYLSLDIEKMYIPRDIFIEAVKISSKDSLYVNRNLPIEDQTKSVMKQFGLDDSSKLIFDSILTLVSGLAAGSATTAATVDPDPTTKVILIAIATDLANAYFSISATAGALNYFEAKAFEKACNNGNLNVIYTDAKYRYTFNDDWDSWETPGYIYKTYFDIGMGKTYPTQITRIENAQNVADYWSLK